ncbi:hypothetical protein [Calidithermus timidus]|uniref:hypothetical protein n=1 Tax=Calidithermus timidus TaxID=307124 RepID=UPI0003771059|nr:hypothetical protein [Calidithermus timidus]
MKTSGRPPHILCLYTPRPLEQLEPESLTDRERVYTVWRQVAPLVRAADPQRYRSVCQALELPDLPLKVLAQYVLRESRLALANPKRQRMAQ